MIEIDDFFLGLRSTEVIPTPVANHNRPDHHTGLRLADKRSLPCPRRQVWQLARDELYEEIMNSAYNKEKKFFCQSYEDKDILDSAVLIMPLVFFCSAVSRIS